ncbi:hypothetical protein BJN42_26730 [Pseudomonas koreensis]|nr:hypothetical protein BJN42_26730 [Pseudomonas koreensis]
MTEQQKGLIYLVVIFGVLCIANVAAPMLDKYLTPDERTFLFLAFVYSGGAIYAIKNRDQLNVFIKKWPTTLIYTAFILYGCKIWAEKVINARTGIEVENIRYASTIAGVLYSVPLSMIGISLCMFTKMALRLFTVDGADEGGKAIAFSVLKICFITSVFGLGMYTQPKADAIIAYTVLADATAVTTCGPAEDNVVYVRKNSEACKRIHVIPFKGIYEMTDVPSKSG